MSLSNHFSHAYTQFIGIPTLITSSLDVPL